MKLTSFIGLFFIIVISIGLSREYSGENSLNINIKQDSLILIIKKQNDYIHAVRMDSLNRIIKEQKQQIEKLKSDSINQKSKVKMNTGHLYRKRDKIFSNMILKFKNKYTGIF